MKIIGLCYPCSCSALISFVVKVGYDKPKTFLIPCSSCKTKRHAYVINHNITLSDEFDLPPRYKRLWRKILKLF